jgi:hypothetical protein
MPGHVELTLDPEHAERFYAENPGAAERAMRERHRLNARSIQRQQQRRTAPSAAVPVRVAVRPRERREARHQARKTSSGDSGDDGPEPPQPACRRWGS